MYVHPHALHAQAFALHVLRSTAVHVMQPAVTTATERTKPYAYSVTSIA